MKNKYCIIGTGRQGTAAAYDLLKFADIDLLLLIDSNAKSIDTCLEKIKKINTNIEIKTCVLDLMNENALTKELIDIDIFLSSVPYSFNLMLTKIAVDTSTSMVDLGGHTHNVIKQLDYHEKAKDKNITIVPDCGMGPGMNVTMAKLAMEQLDIPKEVRIWDGGLPRNPKQPWNYSLFFNIQGLTNEYDASAFFLKDGKIDEVLCFEGYELLDFEHDLGQLEAAVTSGGLSTMPWTYEGKLKVLENKTLRYKGHWEWMKAYRQLGLFSEDEVFHNGHKIIPREFYHQLLEPQLDTKDFNDICIMRVICSGIKEGENKVVTIDAVETYDDDSGLMAMEKWTGWHASIMMQHIMNNKIDSGAYPIEKALSGEDFYLQAKRRNYNINIKVA